MTGGSGLPAVQANTKQDVAAVQRVNASEIARTRVESRADLAKAGAVLAGRESQSAAAAAPLARAQQAAGLVARAGALNIATPARVAVRDLAVAPMAAGQGLDIASGVGPLKAVPVEEAARMAALQPALLQGGCNDGGSPGQQAMAYDKAQLAGLHGLTDYQLSTTQAMSRSDLAQAGALLTNSDPSAAAVPVGSRIGHAARLVGDAVAMNSGTQLQVAAERLAYAPMTAAANVDIVAGGADIVEAPVLQRG
jgi:hypothetical protein